MAIIIKKAMKKSNGSSTSPDKAILEQTWIFYSDEDSSEDECENPPPRPIHTQTRNEDDTLPKAYASTLPKKHQPSLKPSVATSIMGKAGKSFTVVAGKIVPLKPSASLPPMYVTQREFKYKEGSTKKLQEILATALIAAYVERLHSPSVPKFYLKDFAAVMNKTEQAILFRELEDLLKNNKKLDTSWWKKIEDFLVKEDAEEPANFDMNEILDKNEGLLQEMCEFVKGLYLCAYKTIRKPELDIFSKVFMTSIHIYNGKEVKAYNPNVLDTKSPFPPAMIFDDSLALTVARTRVCMLYMEREANAYLQDAQKLAEEAKHLEEEAKHAVVADDSKFLSPLFVEFVRLVTALTEGMCELKQNGILAKFRDSLESWPNIIPLAEKLASSKSLSPVWTQVVEEAKKLAELAKKHQIMNLKKLAIDIRNWKKIHEALVCQDCGEKGNENNTLKKVSCGHFLHETCFSRAKSAIGSSEEVMCKQCNCIMGPKEEVKEPRQSPVVAGPLETFSCTYCLGPTKDKCEDDKCQVHYCIKCLDTKIHETKYPGEFTCDCGKTITYERLEQADATYVLCQSYLIAFPPNASICHHCGMFKGTGELECGHKICQECAIDLLAKGYQEKSLTVVACKCNVQISEERLGEIYHELKDSYAKLRYEINKSSEEND